MYLWCLFVLALAASTSGLSVGPVTLRPEQKYIVYTEGPSENNSLIRCNYELDEGEEVTSIDWEFREDRQTVGTFRWTRGSLGVATGILNGAVNLTREDGNLELTSLAYELNGFYTCTVTVDGGKNASATDEVLIVEWTARTMSGDSIKEGCHVFFTIKFPVVFPRPTALTGLYSPQLGGYYETRELFTVVHSNGSMQYHINTKFEISGRTPTDAFIRSVLGITKADGTYITLFKRHDYLNRFQQDCKELTPSDTYNVSNNFPNDSKHGCKQLTLDNTYSVTYNSHKQNFFGDLVPFQELKATVVCAEGYIPKGSISSMNMVCRERGIFHNNTIYEWQSDEPFFDFFCKPNDAAPTSTPSNPKPRTPSAAYSNTFSLRTVNLMAAIVLTDAGDRCHWLLRPHGMVLGWRIPYTRTLGEGISQLSWIQMTKPPFLSGMMVLERYTACNSWTMAHQFPCFHQFPRNVTGTG